ncbi:LamG domain-containing protein [Ectothiorhodospiraceae bacterium WFHF3C12]|nr:LamG domain-containing protein [Ectothiorhodospiraceae bacterium WFHF3C12]
MTGHREDQIRAGLPKAWLATVLFAAATMLAGCGGGAETQTNPEQTENDTSSYSGPPPQTDDISAFRNSLWQLVRPSNRCAACHDAGGQAPTFANNEDVNAAYAAANSVVNLDSPDESLMVTRVAGGHNCWENDPAFCADMIASAIETWAGGQGDATTRIELEEPADLREPGDSYAFPTDPNLFGPVHDLLTQHCSDCHTESAPTPQQPYFAQDDIAAAYEAAQDKMNLATPADSRFVIRLRDDFHNCWSDCADDASEMRGRIADLAAQATTVQLDPSLVNSRALTLSEGLLATTGGRYEGNVIALYDFSSGAGTGQVLDSSGVEPAAHLNVVGDCEVSDYGLRCAGGDSKAQASPSASAKFADHITRTGEYSVEAWVVPGNVSQEGPARIVSYSGGDDRRNFTLGQTLYNYDFLNRSTGTDGDGTPALSTPDGDEVLQATLQHVVMTFDPINGRRIYVNGELATQADPLAGEGLSGWNDTYVLVMGNETSMQYPWEGSIRLLAVYERALTEEQINQNFEAGVGQKFFLLFHVGELMGVADSDPAYDSYLLFEVSQFDQYSYLFDRPHFVNLNDGWEPQTPISIEGLRIGINGQEAQVGQAYVNLDTEVTADAYDPLALGQQLSRMGTVISLQQGPENDEFFLTFDDFNGQSSVRTPPGTPSPAAPAVGDPRSVIGLRTFDEIDATMSSLTGIPRDNANVRDTFETIKQQLPTSPEIEGFLSAHQMGMAQLAIEYCSALVEDQAAREAFFGTSFDFNADVATAFQSEADRQLIVDALYDNIVGQNLDTAPARADVYAELADPANQDDGTRPANLFDRLTEDCGGGSCDAQRTRTIVKAMCASTLGSTVTLIQ